MWVARLAVMPMRPFQEKEKETFKALLFKLLKYSNRKILDQQGSGFQANLSALWFPFEEGTAFLE